MEIAAQSRTNCACGAFSTILLVNLFEKEVYISILCGVIFSKKSLAYLSMNVDFVMVINGWDVKVC